jgi:signal transduction histidine kinase
MIYVTDNGKGIENTDNDYLRALRAKGHFGVWNMKERAASMNSKLIIDSEPGEGTTIKLIIQRQGEA